MFIGCGPGSAQQNVLFDGGGWYCSKGIGFYDMPNAAEEVWRPQAYRIFLPINAYLCGCKCRGFGSGRLLMFLILFFRRLLGDRRWTRCGAPRWLLK